MKPAFVILWLAPIWCVAVVVKALGARSRKQPYRFAMWDGGLMLSGNELGPVGQIVWARARTDRDVSARSADASVPTREGPRTGAVLAIALGAVAIGVIAWGMRL